MFRWIDRSTTLSRLIRSLSELIARRRGLPVIIGMMLIIAGLALQVVDVYGDSRLIQVLGLVIHSGGILLALIGLLLAAPLGD